jgi:hypothetical protein
MWTLPHPPRRLGSQDPVWTLTAQQTRQRARDERKAQKILEKISNNCINQQKQNPANGITPEQWERRRSQVSAWQKEWLDTVYGPEVTLRDRQHFLEEYGCTGWTDEVLDMLMEIGASSGFVEIGAGNGQRARVLTDRYQQQQDSRDKLKYFDFVMAYDNGSHLPLSPEIYHSKTLPAYDHFYDKVLPLHADSVEATVKQWQCRGRVLLLVYPPPLSDLALVALRAYDQVHGQTVVYVGEGRNGATANNAFFDYSENSENLWFLDKIMDVKSFGSKGYERCTC